MTDRRLTLLLIAVATLLASGCATTAYVSTVDTLDAVDGYQTLEVEPIVNGEGVWEGCDEEGLAAIRQEYISRIQKGELFSQVVTQTDLTDGVLVLRCTFTSFEKGSQAARYFIGLGAGTARLLMDVQLVDKATGDVIGGTLFRRSVSGGFFGGTADPRDMGIRMAGSVSRFIEKRGQGGKPSGTVLSMVDF